MEADLLKSGLVPGDLDVRVMEDPERAMALVPPGIDGYVIPYFSIHGVALPFYRVRLHNTEPKYKQVKDSNNHVYFPKAFKRVASQPGKDYIIITEGEKKAAKATKEGFPTVAFSGVDSWRTRTIILPEDTELTAANIPGGRAGLIKAKLPTTADTHTGETLAVGLQDLIDYVVANRKKVVIIYDTEEGGIKYEVQRATASFAFELRHRGIPFSHIRQVVLTPTDKLRGEKIGLDDYLLANGSASLDDLIRKALNRRSAFPRHPNVREFLNKKLQSSKISRKDIQAIGIAILSDMDARGTRLRSTSDEQLYYFDNLSRKLIKVQMAASGREIMNDTEFARFLYNEYGISIADNRLMQWFATQFASEEPIDRVQPFRVLARYEEEDAIAYQINDGQYVKVSAKGIDILDNGTSGVMFESGHVQPIDAAELLAAYEKLAKKPLENRWAKVLSHVRLKQDPNLPKATALLFYLSPWLYRWRGTQLPIELVIGESGSGKSSLYELRLSILLGYPALRNAPQDLKDWHASIASTGGLHVTDNVQLVDKNLRQRLSDELCRIVTEPDPHVEMRKLYSNAELVRIPVSSVFAITAIQQPFLNADLIQRSVIIELDKAHFGSGSTRIEEAPSQSGAITFDSKWVQHRMEEHGSRTEWIAHHLFVLSKFFKLVQAKWDSRYLAQHRLINLEQIFCLMAEALGEPSDWVSGYLSGNMEKMLSESDWALEGLMKYADIIRTRGKGYQTHQFSAADIAAWAALDEDFQECVQLTNSRRLGRYMQSHKQMVASMAGIQESGKTNNKQMFRVS